ncbi:DUF4367 domain-containing protein [Parafrankia sp. EUN1f]|uniref:DUF4367 domain-containing protein n=1 Tax=Parafrankia sp. EUN1f TaxID=102897 RepID=UPI0001C44A8A|nr:DUF4367 domain-containing protein [Parafrankia sp. EUN1f]EFC84383.1 hypothetical protein FrEUN1fDRAFT_2443 [Parafrankia sp. EUN1f]
MGHTSDGVLRRLLDEPAGVTDADREHTAACPRCLAVLATMRADADAVHAALSFAVPAGGEHTAGEHAVGEHAVGEHAAGEHAAGDIDAAWRRLVASMPATGTGRKASAGERRRPHARPRTGRPSFGRRFAGRPAVAALVAAAVLAGAGTAAANGWLQIFQTERVAVIGLGPEDLVALPDLGAYGDLDMASEPDLRDVDSAATATRRTGLDLPAVTRLPAGIAGEPVYETIDQVEAVFTFSAQRAARTAADEGETLPPVPPGLDGTRVRMVAGPGVARVWSSGSGAPGLVVARAVAPRAFSTGVPFETVRDYILSLPGLPADVAAQLRTFAADGSTLPLPVPTAEATTRQVKVNGIPATALTSRDGTLAAVVWVQGGVVCAVAGSLSENEILTVARELR